MTGTSRLGAMRVADLDPLSPEAHLDRFMQQRPSYGHGCQPVPPPDAYGAATTSSSPRVLRAFIPQGSGRHEEFRQTLRGAWHGSTPRLRSGKLGGRGLLVFLCLIVQGLFGQHKSG